MRQRQRRPRLGLLFGLLLLPVLSGVTAQHPSPVTLVARPWATATLDGGPPFVVPSTVPLEPGEYRLSITRTGYAPIETSIRVEGRAPQHHVFHLTPR